jgi:hypothetical protein
LLDAPATPEAIIKAIGAYDPIEAFKAIP